MKIRIRPVFLFCLLIAAGGALCAQDGSWGKVIISYTLDHLEQRASNQLAVWIEDAGGRYVKTLFATDFMARRRGFRIRPQCCPEWVKASGLADMTDGEIDAISGATQKPGKINLSWDCTDQKGKPVPSGVYLYKVEGNIAWEKRVLWSGRIKLGRTASRSAATAQWLPEEAKDAGVLVTKVSARFEPASR